MFFPHSFSVFSLNKNFPLIALKQCSAFTYCPFFFKTFTSLSTLFGLLHKSFISCSVYFLIALLTIFLKDFFLFYNYSILFSFNRISHIFSNTFFFLFIVSCTSSFYCHVVPRFFLSFIFPQSSPKASKNPIFK